MGFEEADYQTAADALAVPIARIRAVADVESSGATFWTIYGEQKLPIRHEAHWFGKLTGYIYNDSHPQISSMRWNAGLAADTREGAWAQHLEAAELDEAAAIQSASWGAFQIMGFHWQKLGFASPQEMRDAMFTAAGQMDAFVRFIKAGPAIEDALQRGDHVAFELYYNGGGYNGAYARKIEDAEARYS
jgi:hypothetical protein